MTQKRAVPIEPEMVSKKKKRPPTAVGLRLEQARLRAGIKSQKDLARLAKVDGQQIWRVETGGLPLSKKLAATLAKVLNVEESYLMYGSGEEEKRPAIGSPVVAQYLRSDLGSDTPPEVAEFLNNIDYSCLALPHPGMKDIHRVREMVEFNLSVRRKLPA
jgi:transcriptional regulator with XRE-family HTH domain